MSNIGGLVHSDVGQHGLALSRRRAAAEWVIRHLWGAGLAFSIVFWGIVATMLLTR